MMARENDVLGKQPAGGDVAIILENKISHLVVLLASGSPSDLPLRIFDPRFTAVRKRTAKMSAPFVSRPSEGREE
jgi:hypothetical protein